MSTTAASIRTAPQTMRRVRLVAEEKKRSFRPGRFIAVSLVFLLFLGMSGLFVFVPNKPEMVVALAAGFVVVLCICRWPIVGTFSCMVLAILFDGLPSPFVHSILADLEVFRNLSYKGLPQFVYVSLFEVVVIITLVSALVRRFHAHERMVRGALYFPIMVYGAVVLFGEMNGLTTGGDFKISLWELRPLGYIVVLYLLALNTVSKPWHIRAMLWISILSIGARLLEGVSRYATMSPDLRAVVEVVLEHDDSLVLVAALALLVPVFLWRKHLPRRLLWTLVAMAPLVLYVIIINHRRAAYFCLILSLIAMVPLIWISLQTRHARMRLAQVLVVISIISPIYVLAFWNSNGSIGQPAQAVRSIIAPSERDYLSNLYRDEENANLHATIALNPMLGIGFGKPMEVVVPMVDVTDIWALQLYMPHNNVLWLWMRMGLPGFAVFWMMVGSSLFLICACVRIGVKRLAYLTSLDEEPERQYEDRKARGLTSDRPGLQVVHLRPREDPSKLSHISDMALQKAHKEETQECAEFLVLAFFALASLVSMLTLALVDQGLMSPRLSSYWGLLLGTLTVGWQIYKVKFRLPAAREKGAEGTALIDNYEELERVKRNRVRVIAGPSNAA